MSTARGRSGGTSRLALPLVLVALSAAAIGAARPRLATRCRGAKNTTDVFALPPPDALPTASLGYRAALADLLFADTLVQYGIHGEERRRFDLVGTYLDAITTLDPKFCQVYRYVDTFIIFQAKGSPSEDDVRHARRLVERGLENCPNDGYLWTTGGQFLAFIATQFLQSEDEKRAYREAGAKALARAAELASSNENLRWQSLAAVGILTQSGRRDAALSFLERVYALTDDEDLRKGVAARLEALREEAAAEQARARAERFQAAWQGDLPFVSRTGLLLLGPAWNPALCAGRLSPRGDDDRSCARTWAEWLRDPVR